jgi:hypothetical protein
MGWTTPYRHRRATVRVVRTCRKGAARDEYYHDRPGTAKSVFQVHAVNESGEVEIKRKLQRSELLPFFEKQEARIVSWKPVGPRTTGPGC